jgi:hypothetical protein
MSETLEPVFGFFCFMYFFDNIRTIFYELGNWGTGKLRNWGTGELGNWETVVSQQNKLKNE